MTEVTVAVKLTGPELQAAYDAAFVLSTAAAGDALATLESVMRKVYDAKVTMLTETQGGL